MAVEIALRLWGYQPGDMRPNWLNFKTVDSLYVVHDFYSDTDGILIADSAYWAQQGIHVNEGGFRSPDFGKADSTKKKVMFIGDSFTWGFSANPIPNHCFTDLLRNETNYDVINLGIPAADPPQYLALAQKYIPRLKPDFVFVMFFMGNDLMQEDRKVTPGVPYFFLTNAGAIFADIDGKHFETAQQAYNYIVSDRYYLHHPKNIIEWLVSKSALLSRLYSVRFRIREKLDFEQAIKDSHITKKYLEAIKAVAAQNHTRLKFVLIPEIKEADMAPDKYRERYKDILEAPQLAQSWLMVKSSAACFNKYPDGHLNNKGHRVYADFLEQYLKSADSQ
ncbi:MAG TPA: SGNH/GDSL hydrolase family protein [Chitinophagales bacterium]|nr:SGNH/GDSL hydrolase family protein [Chitinophagales bacterium]